jgi:PAS domain-containing protein
MSFVENRVELRPESGEAPFEFSETFFTRTDKRGVIQAGNEVFRRVANYDWDKLLGAPHKIIRHPDMPKAVFQLLWDTIKSGQPMGAYIKNNASDGLHYWVYAIVFPLRDGYLSVRLKPSSEMFDVVKEVYAAVREQELSGAITPVQSSELLLARIKELGFASYSTFATHALAEEIAARDVVLNEAEDRSIVLYRQMMNDVMDLHKLTDGLALAFGKAGNTPTNMRLIASGLEPTGGPISSLSQNYEQMSNEISNWFNNFISNSDNSMGAIQRVIEEGLFQKCSLRIMQESFKQFGRERRSQDKINMAQETRYLESLSDLCRRNSESGLNQIGVEVKNIAVAISTMRRYISGLGATRVMSKIEAARLGGDKMESMSGIISQLGDFQTTIEAQLDVIDDKVREIQSCAVQAIGC